MIVKGQRMCVPEYDELKRDIMEETHSSAYAIVDPAFLVIMRFPLKKARLFFFFFLLENHFLENGLESPLIFVFILKGKTK